MADQMTLEEIEKLRRAAEAVLQRARGKTVNVSADSGVRSQMLRHAMAKTKRRKVKSLEWQDLKRVRQARTGRRLAICTAK
jgi:hypothetical protein